MTLITAQLDKAAFLMTWGASLTSIEGTYPANKFILRLPKLVYLLEKYLPIVNYKKLCRKRRAIKVVARKKAGLPEHFTGDNGTGFTFEDIAHT